MALPKKRRGFRSITVAGQTYRWRFCTQGTGFLTVVQETGAGQRLVVALPEWHDPWLYVGELGGRQVNTPAHLTPAFAEQAIRRALELGWRPAVAGQAFEMQYVGGRFRPGASGA